VQPNVQVTTSTGQPDLQAVWTKVVADNGQAGLRGGMARALDQCFRPKRAAGDGLAPVRAGNLSWRGWTQANVSTGNLEHGMTCSHWNTDFTRSREAEEFRRSNRLVGERNKAQRRNQVSEDQPRGWWAACS